MKKKELVRALVLVIAVIIIVVIIKLIQGFDSNKKELKKLGYSKDEISIIYEKLDKDTIKKITTLEYNEYLDDIISSKYYIPYNLDRYLAYSKKESNVDNIISVVNVKRDFEPYTETKETDLNKGYAMIVNKYNYLKDYEPENIVPISNWYAFEGHSCDSTVYDAYKKMWTKAKEDGVLLLVNSSYRTNEEQEKEYKSHGDDYASRPGFSEHQTGYALDIVTYGVSGNSFEDTDEFKWLDENAYKYGFILRYPKNKENITGYSYESWHYRYVGVELAKKVKDSNLAYDEYYAYFCEYKNEC